MVGVENMATESDFQRRKQNHQSNEGKHSLGVYKEHQWKPKIDESAHFSLWAVKILNFQGWERSI